MVEMLEVKNVIVNVIKDSLILFDEIGCGMLMYDGMVLVQVIIEYVYDYIGVKILFSMYYYELMVFEDKFFQLKNVYVCVEEYNGMVVFFY